MKDGLQKCEPFLFTYQNSGLVIILNHNLEM